MAYQVAIPDFKIQLAGKDITSRMKPRLISLTLRESRADQADQVDIVLDDAAGTLDLPPLDAELQISIGWAAGNGVEVGLVDKGTFKVDEVEASGPAEAITIRARSADFGSDLKLRQERSFMKSTLGAIVAKVASEHGLKPHCAPELADIEVDVHQSRESNMALLRRLGREHDAVATIKAGKVILSPIGAAKTAGGGDVPTVTIERRRADRYSYTLSKREEADGVTASWHDQDAGEKKHVTAGSTGQGKHGKRLSRTYATESEAKRAAAAELSRLKRDPAKFSLSLALGQASIYPEQKIKAVGFRRQVVETAWIVAEVEHSLSQQGFVTNLQMESAA